MIDEWSCYDCSLNLEREMMKREYAERIAVEKAVEEAKLKRFAASKVCPPQRVDSVL